MDSTGTKPMSVVVDLRQKADYILTRIEAYKGQIEENQRINDDHQRTLAELELEFVEYRTAADIIEKSGLSVTRTEAGLPFVAIAEDFRPSAALPSNVDAQDVADEAAWRDSR